uniref:Uncharacterized protein n=1 Tax=Panagrolaimus davidi TaxID=227884 RepID=A0A914QMT7_9BILA
MVKSKVVQAEYVKEFVDERKKVAAIRKERAEELDQMIATLTPKLKEEYTRAFKQAFKVSSFISEEPAVAAATTEDAQQSEPEKELDAAQRRIKDLETQLRNVEDRIQMRDDRISTLERQINDMLIQYQDLLKLKIQRDTEFQA